MRLTLESESISTPNRDSIPKVKLPEIEKKVIKEETGHKKAETTG